MQDETSEPIAFHEIETSAGWSIRLLALRFSMGSFTRWSVPRMGSTLDLCASETMTTPPLHNH
jgi:hypothetical protein